jgi:hypothetical protein
VQLTDFVDFTPHEAERVEWKDQEAVVEQKLAEKSNLIQRVTEQKNTWSLVCSGVCCCRCWKPLDYWGWKSKVSTYFKLLF